MSPVKSIATGILFLLLAAAGVIYVVARPKPLVEHREPERLEFKKPESSPAPTPPIVPEKVISTKHSAAPRHLNPIKQYAVQILSPSMAETYTVPATVTLRASANYTRELKSIEFYKSPDATICESLSTRVNFPKELKIGEAHAAPYEVQWNVQESETVIIRAVATYTSGEQQISPPVVIIIKTEQEPAETPSLTTPVMRRTKRRTLNRTCPDLAQAINYWAVLRVAPRSAVNICPDNPDDPLNTSTQLDLHSKVIFGIYSNAPSFEYWVNGGKILLKEDQPIWDLAELKSRPGVYTVIAKSDDGCDCTSIQALRVIVENSCTRADPIDPPENQGGGEEPPPTTTIDNLPIQRPIWDLAPPAGKRSTRKPVRSETPPESVEVSPPVPTPVPNTATPRRANEKDWIKISWTPRVKSDDSVSIKVVYNRTTESFQVSNTAGQVSEEIKLARLLRDWFGDEYQTFGDVRLRTAGLKCDSCNQEQYQSFDKEKLEWSWPLKPEDTGRQSFNIELWVKGEPRDKNLGKPAIAAEKVWASIDNKIEVTEPFLTRNTVYMGGGLFGVLGLGLCLRGFKGQFHVGDTYNVENAVAVGRNVTMTNTTVNQETNGEKRDA